MMKTALVMIYLSLIPFELLFSFENNQVITIRVFEDKLPIAPRLILRMSKRLDFFR
jgi:hypothetical protein